MAVTGGSSDPTANWKISRTILYSYKAAWDPYNSCENKRITFARTKVAKYYNQYHGIIPLAIPSLLYTKSI